MVEVAVSARQGDSGGPIFNSRGELAGVLFGEGHGRTSGSYCGRVRWFLVERRAGHVEQRNPDRRMPLEPGASADGGGAGGRPGIPLPPTPFIQASRASGIAAPSANGSRIGVVASTRSPPLGVTLNALCGMGRRGRPFHRRAAKNLVGRDRRHADHHPHVALVRQGAHGPAIQVVILEPIREPSGTVPILRSGTIRRMVGEQNGTVPFSETVLG